MDRMKLQRREQHLVNTDPQGSCYNGCHFSSELVWGNWQTIETDIPFAQIKKRLVFWTNLNLTAIDGRGEGARAEFRALQDAGLEN
jgi:hypothetical protein